MTDHGIVLFADVVDSRALHGGPADQLRRMVGQLNREHAGTRLAAFDFTQGDEIQGLLRSDTDPFASVVHLALDETAPTLRWAIVHGALDEGNGPATQRTGPAFVEARRLIERTRTRHVGLLAAAGDPAWDPVLEGLAPVLPALLADLTPRQRAVARLTLDEGLRQTQAAEILGIARQTVSMTLARGNVRSIQGVAGALHRIFQAAISAGRAQEPLQ